MGNYTADSRVQVHPFSRQVEGEEVIIGVRETFLVLPPDAVEILDHLASGKTVGEAQALYLQKNNETPDMEDFLGSMEQAGFVQPYGTADSARRTAIAAPRDASTDPPVLRYHFENFPPALARALTSRPALLVYGGVIVTALAALVAEPSLLPRWDALLFTGNMTQMGLVLLLFSFAMLVLHELAHLVAARAVGVPSRLGIGHRLWVLVAEADVSGLWSLPRPRRYMTLLAGPLLDLVCAAILTCLGYAALKGWVVMSPLSTQLCRALLLMYLLNVLWQCNFYLRTDFYFALANFFSCKNLMGDTEAFLRAQWSRLRGKGEAVELPRIPARELRVVRGYAVFWVLGRMNMLWILATVTLPLLWGYLSHIAVVLGAGFSSAPLAFMDALVMGSVTLTVQIAGLWMWLRSLLKPKGKVPHEVAI